jgi:hypothetical protein
MVYESPCGLTNANDWKMFTDLSVSPPTVVVFPPQTCQVECNPFPIMTCSDLESGWSWYYDGHKKECISGTTGTGCWRKGQFDVDPNKNILSQRNDAGQEPNVVDSKGYSELWTEFAKETWGPVVDHRK